MRNELAVAGENHEVKQLWAPWRMEYILEGKSSPDDGVEQCVFCDVHGEKDGPQNLILHRGDYAYVVMNKFPYSNGHLMIVPNRHVRNFEVLNAEEGMEIFLLSQRSLVVLRRTVRAQGFNMGLNLGKVAGAGIDPHLHFHVVPRWDGDHNFMTVLAEVRSIPEHIETTYGTLRQAFLEEFSGTSG